MTACASDSGMLGIHGIPLQPSYPIRYAKPDSVVQLKSRITPAKHRLQSPIGRSRSSGLMQCAPITRLPDTDRTPCRCEFHEGVTPWPLGAVLHIAASHLQQSDGGRSASATRAVATLGTSLLGDARRPFGAGADGRTGRETRPSTEKVQARRNTHGRERTVGTYRKTAGVSTGRGECRGTHREGRGG